MTGELDLNTPISQAEDFYRALKIYNVPTALVRFPDEYHGTYGVRPSNPLRTQLYFSANPLAETAIHELSHDV